MMQTIPIDAASTKEIARLDKLLRPDGQLRQVPYKELASFEKTTLAIWCKLMGIWQIPTVELIVWLREIIGQRRALEVCAGRGILGREIGVTQTDARIFERDPYRAMFIMMGESVRPLAPEVVRMDAVSAVQKYQPEIVFGAWVTQFGTDGSSSPVGVDEERLLEHVQTYIVIGNKKTHGAKNILRKFAHTSMQPPWLASRSMYPEDNVIYIFNRDVSVPLQTAAQPAPSVLTA